MKEEGLIESIDTQASIVTPHAVPHGQLENDVKGPSVLANNATKLAAHAIEEKDFNIQALVEQVAMGKLKVGGFVRERCSLNGTKLLNSVRSKYRAEFPQLYRPGQRVPSAIEERLQDAVGSWITDKLASVLNQHNTTQLTRRFSYRKPKIAKPDIDEDSDAPVWLEDITAKGENRLPYKEMRFACKLEIGRLERRLKDLRAKPTPDLDLEKKYEANLLRQQTELVYIEEQIAKE